MIIGTIIPNNYFAPWGFVKSLMALPKYDFTYWEGSTIFNNRNQVFKYAQHKDDDLLFIDSDILFKPEDVAKMEQHLKTHDIVTGVCPLSFPPYAASIFKRIDGDYELTQPLEVFAEIGACGAAFLGISARAIKILGDCPFNLISEGTIQHGEDVSFCHLARERGLKIWCDPTIQVGQIRVGAVFPTYFA